MLLRLKPEHRMAWMHRMNADGAMLRTYEGIDDERKCHVIKGTQDVEPIIEENKRLYTSTDGYWKGRHVQLAASVPNIIVEQWMKQGISIFRDEDLPKKLAMLTSPEHSYLRSPPRRGVPDGALRFDPLHAARGRGSEVAAVGATREAARGAP